MAGRRTISKAEPVELTDAEVAEWDRQIEQSGQKLAQSGVRPASVSSRWNQASLEVVKRAARLHGVPYQTYLKEAAIRTALADLSLAERAGVK
jgi:predicted DNA binding CopG/RHH family protein